MDLTQDFADSSFVITGYQADHVLVNNEPHFKSLIVSPERLITDWDVTSIRRLNKDCFSVLDDLQLEIILVGSSEQGYFLDGELIAWFAQKKIGLEHMSMAAACRTYRILVSEGRRAAAALIFLDKGNQSLGK